MFRLAILAVLLAAPAVLCGDVVNGPKYEVFTDSKVSASQAESACSGKGGKLADFGTVCKLGGIRETIGNYGVTTEFWIAGKTSMNHNGILADSDLAGSGDRCRILSNWPTNGPKWNVHAKNCGEARFFICEF